MSDLPPLEKSSTTVVECHQSVRVVNREGLHARPCHAVVSAALEYQSELRITCGAEEANGKSILELMTLKATCGSELILRASGQDARALVSRLVALIAAGFDESS